jgi:hypothetical protein
MSLLCLFFYIFTADQAGLESQETRIPKIISSLPSENTSRTGVIVPLYVDPTSEDWEIIYDAKKKHLEVPIIIIINPDNGPGSFKDIGYVNGINRLQSANVVVLGYVYTDNAKRTLSSVRADIDSYQKWYHNVDGIFFDEMSNYCWKREILQKS